MRDVAGCSDGWARWALRSDEEEKDDKYGNCCANGDAPCDLSVGHDGVRDGARGVAWSRGCFRQRTVAVDWTSGEI